MHTMSLDLVNMRLASAFLQKTELKFDLVSAIAELAAQIRLEFDFKREARIMDSISKQFAVRILFSFHSILRLSPYHHQSCHCMSGSFLHPSA